MAQSLQVGVIAALTASAALVGTLASSERATSQIREQAAVVAPSPPIAHQAQEPGPETVATHLLRPNMRALKAADLRIVRRGDRRRLRFESTLANTGVGPMEVRPNAGRNCPAGQRHAQQVIYRDVDRNGVYKRRVDKRKLRRSAGCMLFHAAHDHWHFEAAARYTLFRPSGDTVLVARKKMSFCLRDTRRVPERWDHGRDYKQFYGACSRDRRQGIMIGWADDYQSYLPGQSLLLPRSVRDGRYCLRTQADAKNLLQETKETDNTSHRGLRISGDRVRLRSARGCGD